ncbi:MAG TPA: hypothetical protein VFL93_09920 [Longimicrobiaceae bacterium]|nr:hypothetical protein [Longimicrobiaceae bacterium]
MLRATEEQQQEWMTDTIEYMAERYPELSREQLGELRTIGQRFCRPVIDNVPSEDLAEEAEKGDAAETEAAAA